MSTIIVLDANILVSSPQLRDKTWQSLISQCAEWGVRLVVPEVAVMEAIKNVRARWAEKCSEIPNVRGFKAFGHDETLQGVVDDISSRIASYETDLHARLAEIGAEITAPPKDVDLMDLARRAAEGRAPFGAKDRDCFRDALIWCSVVRLAQDNRGDDVWFVSNNTDDFGPAAKKDWTGMGTGTREDCPILFHADLGDELEQLRLADRVRYVTNIRSLEQHLAAQFAPITSADLRAKLDDGQLTEKLKDAVFGLVLNPFAAALDPGTETATLAMTEPVDDSWVFLDGAGRGAAGWTARFAVDAETVVASTVNSEVVVVKKELNFTGDLAVAADGQISALDVTTVAALPDDPMRKQWPDLVAVTRAYETSSRASEAIRRVLNDSSPYDDQARLMAEVELWQETAAGANLLLQSDSVRRAFGELTGTAQAAENLRRMIADLTGAAQAADGIRRRVDEVARTVQIADGIQRVFSEAAGTAQAAEKIRATFNEVAGTAQTAENIQRTFSDLSKHAAQSIGPLDQTARFVTDTERTYAQLLSAADRFQRRV
ncbi:PIN domain-containing protein [Nocardia salmonicida]|uniref:PIN domain-containing protein n=1 Tax=Nocardia salmonicida TaxID=53431 RepID=UPI0037974CD3